jgi:SOS-response transcriptional repressor LexA
LLLEESDPDIQKRQPPLRRPYKKKGGSITMDYYYEEEHVPRAEKVLSREKEILDIIVKFDKKHAYTPSMREIKKRSSLQSLSTIHSYINRLKNKGYITSKQNGAHSFLVILESEYKDKKPS